MSLVMPIFFGVGSAVVVATVLAHCLFGRKPKPKKLITLENPNIKYQLPLIGKTELSHDSRKFRFGLPSPEHVLGLPIGKHIHLSATINDELVIRAYTPVTSDDQKGYVDLVVKVYFKNVHPKFPEGGKMSQYLEGLKIGDTIDVRGPSGRLQYAGNGQMLIKKTKTDPSPATHYAKKINLIAGGTGIAPMYQLISHICDNVKGLGDSTELRLLYANQSREDILLWDELERFQNSSGNKLKVWYTVDRPDPDWQYSSGFISADMIREHLFPPGDDVFVLMCGPPPMINFACTPALDQLGYSPERRFAY